MLIVSIGPSNPKATRPVGGAAVNCDNLADDTSSRRKVMSLSRYRFLGVFCLAVAVSHASADEQDEAKFPFPVEVDKAKGNTGIHPNRIRDRDTGMWYVYVPGGKYQIGSNKRSDSKAIEVTLTGFYISEKRVSHAQIAQQFETELTPFDIERIEKIMKAGKEGDEKLLRELLGRSEIPKEYQDYLVERLRKEWQDYSVEEMESAVWIGMVYSIFFRRPIWPALWKPGLMHPSEELDSRVDEFLHSLDEAQGTTEPRREKQKSKPVKLTAKQLNEAKQIILQYNKEVQAFRAQGDAPYQGTSYDQAAELAAKFRASLPTEAQWEVAARLHAAKRIQLDGMLDFLMEWCSDYYAYDYFQRRDGFRDPKGPPRGRLSQEQLRGGSSFGIARKWFARRVHVLKGREVDLRFYGYNGAPFGEVFSTIRLVFNPD
jgi:formylglycine-generating enzyme required for sulfatase activity